MDATKSPGRTTAIAASLAFLFTLGFGGCSGSQPTEDAGMQEATAEDSAQTSRDFTLGGATLGGSAAQPGPSRARFTLGEVADDRITEASGIVASRQHDDILWTHNDSGGDPLVFAIGLDGSARGAFEVEDARLEDWEDIELGSGPEAGRDYLYIGDIGDNRARRTEIYLYRVAEPAPLPEAEPDDDAAETEDAARLTLTYPDGPRDAETLLLDEATSTLYIVSKRAETVSLYETQLEFEDGDARVLRFVADITFPRVPFLDEGGQGAVGGDFDVATGSALIKTYSGVFLLAPNAGRPWYESDPVPLYYELEPQGEAIAFGPGGRYYTLSEERSDIPAVLYAYTLPALD